MSKTARHLKCIAGTWLVLAAVFAAPRWAAADELETAPETALVTWRSQAFRKLGRGAANVLTGPLELLRMPYLVGQRDGGVAAVTVGVAQGFGAGFVREVAGVVEILTWPISFPTLDFVPLVTPEFVYAHGDWTPEPP